MVNDRDAERRTSTQRSAAPRDAVQGALRAEDIRRIEEALRGHRNGTRETSDQPAESERSEARTVEAHRQFLEQLAAPEFLYLQIEEMVPYAEPVRRVTEAAAGRSVEGEQLTKRERIASGVLGAVEAVLETCHIPTTPTHLVHWLETFHPERAPLLHAMGSFYAEHAQARIFVQSQAGARMTGAGEHAARPEPEAPTAPDALSRRLAALRELHADPDGLALWERMWPKMSEGARRDLLGFLDAEQALLEEQRRVERAA